MNRSVVLGAVLAWMAASVPGTTRADQIFDFSFTNSAGNVAGTVTGTIDIPLAGDGTAAATDVTITSYPGALGNIGTPPVDATAWATQVANTFTVTGGNITNASFVALGSGLPDSAQLTLASTFGQLTDFSGDGGTVLGTITFTPAVATPEPGTITMLGTGLLALGGVVIRRRKNKTAIDKPTA